MAGLQMVYHVVVEGTIGAGKTTLVKNILPLLKSHFQCWIIPEPIDHWLAYGSSKENVLGLMYANPKQYSFLFQVVASVTKVKELVEQNQEVKGS
jgi:deoxyadenosine/deoxycytidine kinase